MTTMTARAKDMNGSTAPPLLRYIGDGGSRPTNFPHLRDEGWVNVDHTKAAPVAQLKVASVRDELRQLAKSGTIETQTISMDTTRVRLTQQGLDFLLTA